MSRRRPPLQNAIGRCLWVTLLRSKTAILGRDRQTGLLSGLTDDDWGKPELVARWDGLTIRLSSSALSALPLFPLPEPPSDILVRVDFGLEGDDRAVKARQ